MGEIYIRFILVLYWFFFLRYIIFFVLNNYLVKELNIGIFNEFLKYFLVMYVFLYRVEGCIIDVKFNNDDVVFGFIKINN